MAKRNKRLAGNWLMAGLVLAGLAVALWPRFAAMSASPAAPQEQTMAKTWNVSATLPPVDIAQPAQFKTATFAVG